MDLGLTGKRALVTAASQGLGKAIALELVKEGAVVVISSRDAKRLTETAKSIASESGVDVSRIHTITADVMNPDDITHLVSEAANKLGGLDILVTNSGGPPAGTFDSLTDDDWLKAVNLNLMSVVRLIREALPWLRRQGGRILNVSSYTVTQPLPNLILSNSIRMAVVGMLKTLSNEVAKDGILIHNLAPGRIGTDRVYSLDTGRAGREGRSVDEVTADEVSVIPLNRYGTPKEFGQYAAFLLSEANSYTTGETIYIDGGIVKRSL